MRATYKLIGDKKKYRFNEFLFSKSDCLIKSHQCQAARLKSTNRIPDLGFFRFNRPNLIKEFHFDLFFVFLRILDDAGRHLPHTLERIEFLKINK